LNAIGAITIFNQMSPLRDDMVRSGTASLPE